MLGILLKKDLLRARRNPLPWLINIALPLCMTALIGLAFGGKSDGGALGHIRFAVVDEDKSLLMDLLRRAAVERKGRDVIEPVFLDREAAMREIGRNKISAVLIVPEHFTRDYLAGRVTGTLELIKNPAESIHPAVIEEFLGAVVTALNAVDRNLQSQFPDWQDAIAGKAAPERLGRLVEGIGDKLRSAKAYEFPPLVGYDKEVRPGESKAGPAFNLFAFLLAGMAGMFLLFLAGNAMTDLDHELQHRTFERYHTYRQSLLPFVAGKVVFAIVLLLISAAILLGGGGLVFGIHWLQPLAVTGLTLGYAIFASGLMALFVAVVTGERAARVLNNLAGMILGIAGGCAFPPQQLPAFLRVHVTPFLPSFWFADTVRTLQFGQPGYFWVAATLKLGVAGLVLIGLAAIFFRRRFKNGLRA